MIKNKKYFIKSQGCQMNQYDSDKISDLLEHHNNMTYVDDASQADLLILNTCSIREKAQEKVFSELGRWKKIKTNNPSVLIAVGGCVASQEGDEIIKRAPFVDAVFGPQTLHRLPELINLKEATGKPQIDISFPEIEKFDNLPISASKKPSAMVSIMEGCSKYCSFCVVPYTRGEEISRPLEDIITEIIKLTSQGASEIILLGQNVNGYRGMMENGKIADFASLIEYIS